MTTSHTVFWHKRAFNLLLQLFVSWSDVKFEFFISGFVYSLASQSPSQTAAWFFNLSPSHLFQSNLWDVMSRRGQHVLPPSALRWTRKHLGEFCRASTSQKRNDQSWAGVLATTKHFASASAPALLQLPLTLEKAISSHTTPAHQRPHLLLTEGATTQEVPTFNPNSPISPHSSLAVSARYSFHPTW